MHLGLFVCYTEKMHKRELDAVGGFAGGYVLMADHENKLSLLSLL